MVSEKILEFYPISSLYEFLIPKVWSVWTPDAQLVEIM